VATSERQLRQDREGLSQLARDILARAKTENRDLTADEVRNFEVLKAEIEKKNEQIEQVQEEFKELALRAAAQVAGESRAVTGRTAVLTREMRYVDWARASGKIKDHDYEGLTIGGYLRAMGTGRGNEAERRALSEGSDGGGGYTVPDILYARMFDRLRAAAQVYKAGAQTVPLDSDVNKIARLATDPTASWVAENAAISTSDPVFEVVTFTPQVVVCHVRASRQLLDDSLNIEDALENAFTQAISREVDRVALRGTGTSPEPRGVRTATGVTETSMGTNGLALSNYDKVIDLLQALAEANGAPPTAAILSPRTAAATAKFKDTTNQPLRRPQALENVPFLSTTQVVNNETQGTSSNASTLFLGDWREVMVGIRSELRIEVLRERYADNLQYGFIAFMRADIQLARPAAMGRLIGIIP
jgi:HK97 family phage major capsid protein